MSNKNRGKHCNIKKIWILSALIVLSAIFLTSCSSDMPESKTTSILDSKTTEVSRSEATDIPNDKTTDVASNEATDLSSNTVKESEITLLDYRGVPIVLNETPQRIVVLSSPLVSVLDELGVNVTGANTLSAEVSSSLKNNNNIAEIGSAVKPDIEILKSLNSDIVVMSSAFGNLASKIADNGMKLWIVDNQTYGQMMNTIDAFGDAFDKREKADEILNSFEERRKALADKTSDKYKPNILVLWGTSDELLVAANKSFACDVLWQLDCNNLVYDVELEPEIPNFMYRLDEDKISKLNPDVIIRIYDDDPEKVKIQFDKNDIQLQDGGTWSHMNAAKSGKVFTLPQAGFAANPGITMMDSFETLASLVFELE